MDMPVDEDGDVVPFDIFCDAHHAVMALATQGFTVPCVCMSNADIRRRQARGDGSHLFLRVLAVFRALLVAERTVKGGDPQSSYVGHGTADMPYIGYRSPASMR